jgi:hypothetical protein
VRLAAAITHNCIPSCTRFVLHSTTNPSISAAAIATTPSTDKGAFQLHLQLLPQLYPCLIQKFLPRSLLLMLVLLLPLQQSHQPTTSIAISGITRTTTCLSLRLLLLLLKEALAGSSPAVQVNCCRTVRRG